MASAAHIADLREAACRPGPRRDHERRRRQHLAAPLAQPSLPLGVQAGHEHAGGAHAEKKRVPPVVEARMLDIDRQAGLLDSVESGLSEELREVALARAGELRLVPDAGLELARRLPEQAEGPVAAAVIPDTRRDNPASAGDARHLAQS